MFCSPFFEKVNKLSYKVFTGIYLNSNTIEENKSIGAQVGVLSITDPDASNTFTYSLVSGDGSTDNASFSIGTAFDPTIAVLYSAASFDFKTKNSYSIRVRAKDQGDLTFEKQFIIYVTNKDESPTFLSILSITDSSMRLNWPPVTTSSSYSIYSSTNETNYSSLASGITSDDYNLSGLTRSTIYYFRVYSKNSFLNSGELSGALPGTDYASASAKTTPASPTVVTNSRTMTSITLKIFKADLDIDTVAFRITVKSSTGYIIIEPFSVSIPDNYSPTNGYIYNISGLTQNTGYIIEVESKDTIGYNGLSLFSPKTNYVASTLQY